MTLETGRRGAPRFLALLAASLAIAAALGAVAGVEGCGPRRSATARAVAPLPAPSNILLITVDTLRADHLSSYGYARQTSPTLDRLAAEGVRFDQTAVQWPKTTPSFASMFTATYSKDNQIVRRTGIPISCRFEVLAKVLQRRGYATQAVVSNGALGREFNFDLGFDTYVETWKLKAGPSAIQAELVTRLAVGLLDGLARSRRPFFLWVHYLDPHFPYAPPGKWSRLFQGDRFFDPAKKIPVSDRPTQQMGGIGRDNVLDGHDDLAFYVARYDAAIAYADAQIGVLLAEMRRHGLLGRTLTVFTADHGESLGEHGYFFDHGRFGFQTCLRVPLIFHYPGVLAPRVDAQPVELLDLAPTVLEAAGMALPGGAWKQGHSLTPRLRGLAASQAPDAPRAGFREGERLAFSEAGYDTNDKWQKMVRDRRFKLFYAQTYHEQRWIAGEGIRFALYDLAADPLETTNVADRFPAEAARLKKALSLWENTPKLEVETEPVTAACKPGQQKPIDPQTRALLHSLGYL